MPEPTTDFSIFDGQELVTYDPAGAAGGYECAGACAGR